MLFDEIRQVGDRPGRARELLERIIQTPLHRGYGLQSDMGRIQRVMGACQCPFGFRRDIAVELINQFRGTCESQLERARVGQQSPCPAGQSESCRSWPQYRRGCRSRHSGRPKPQA